MIGRVIACVCAIAALPARAVLPDEIQVYLDDINKPGEPGLELHVNTTPSGRTTPDFPGEITPGHGLRITPEFSYGLTQTLEAGFYMPFVFPDNGHNEFAGPKVRLKWLPLQTGETGGGFAGVNFEYAWVKSDLEQATRAGELRPIVGWRSPEWLVAANPILDFDLAGPEKGARPSFEPAIKASRKVAQGIDAGLEYYGNLGPAGQWLPLARQAHSLYLAFDVDHAPWVFNFGVGRGWYAADRWTVKMIFEIPL